MLIKTEEEVRNFFTRFGKEHDFKETGFRKGSVPRIYINLKIETEIKAIILGPKIRNAYDDSSIFILEITKKFK